MKGAKEHQLKKCIYLTLDEFEEIVFNLYDEPIEIEVSLDGITIMTDKDCVDVDELYQRLAKYFDVDEVTSIHADDCEYVGIWIVYNAAARARACMKECFLEQLYSADCLEDKTKAEREFVVKGIEDRVEDIFADLQRINGITSGDCVPEQWLMLNEATNKLADVIIAIVKTQG